MYKLKSGRNWWELSRFVPEDKADVVLWACGGAVLLFLVLTVAGFSIASRRGSDRRRAEDELERISQRLDSKVDAVELEKWKEDAGKEASARGEAERMASDLAKKLAQAEDDRASLKQQVERLTQQGGKVGKALAATTEEFERLRSENKRLKDLTRGAASLGRELDQAKQALASGRKELASLREAGKATASEREKQDEEVKRLKAEHETQLAELRGRLAESLESVKKLDAEVAQYPKRPLPDDEAERRYHELLEEVGTFKERDKKIELLFKAMLLLVGTNYETKASRMWHSERKLRQAELDRAAYTHYKEAAGKIRANPKAHDENIDTLNAALAKVLGSRYERSVRKLIDQQHEAKAKQTE